jgi:SpoIID/LytB domain protein
MKGTTVDNRALFVVADKMPSAAQLAQWDVRPITRQLLEAIPLARIRVSAGNLPPVEVGMKAGDEGIVSITSVNKGGALLVHRVEHSVGYKEHGFSDRRLREKVLVAPDHTGSLAVINLVHAHVLVAGILPSEIFATSPMEALKAQAVTARGELFAKIGKRHLTDPYLLCSEQHCQVYKGLTAEHPRANQAAQQTTGELAFIGEDLVDSVYSACCGGHTEPNEVVWDQPPSPALRGTVDGAGAIPKILTSEKAVRKLLDLPRSHTFCGNSSFNQKGDVYRWTRTFPVERLNKIFADLGVGTVKDLKITERGPGGRLRSLIIVGSRKTAQIHRELPVRRKMGNLRSGLFVIDRQRDGAGNLVSVTLKGGGFGHGSGMCQQGAIGMAEAGYDYRAILRHYYGGAEVRKVF